MDPISIAASATSLAAFAFSAGRGVYDYIDGIRNVDSTLLQLKSEVDALISGLQSIAARFRSKNVVEFLGNAGFYNPQSLKLLVSVNPLLGDCRKTLKSLDGLLDTVRGVAGKTGIMKRSKRAFKLDLASKDVEAIRHQIRSYTSAIQVTLQMVAM